MTNLIHLVGEVNEEMFLHFSTQLAKIENLPDSSRHALNIILSSEGGTSYDGLAIASRMRSSPIKIYVEVHGKCMSAATIILAAGDYRTMGCQSWIMLHDSSGKVKGPLTELCRAVEQLESEEQQWANLLELYTGTPEEAWRKLSKKTTYLSASQALQLGLIDEIIKGKK